MFKTTNVVEAAIEAYSYIQGHIPLIDYKLLAKSELMVLVTGNYDEDEPFGQAIVTFAYTKGPVDGLSVHFNMVFENGFWRSSIPIEVKMRDRTTAFITTAI